jgi:3-phenylpropionate/trans-cinnamate dioxygenase ferredoxin reductase subunit
MTMTSRPTLVIIGASMAGAKAAESARESGYDGRILLIGEEPHAPYERPPLSKEVLRGEKDIADARVHPDGFYDEHDIELVTDAVVGIDTFGRTVTLASGSTIAFETAVIATGAMPRRLQIDGADLAGVHYLRTADDAARLREAIRSASRVAVIGAGWIGSEVAASARQMGAEVVLVDSAATPLQRVVGDRIGGVFASLHADNGVALRLRTGVRELQGRDRVQAVVLSDDRVEPVDVVVAGIGVAPRTELADAALGMRVDNGVVVDQHLATNIDGIYAAGDVANAWHPHYHRFLRIEHWANALNQGVTAGRNAVGGTETYRRLPSFFSDQYDLGMEYVGYGQDGDELIVRGDLESRKFIAFWHREGKVSAAMSVNIWDVGEDLKAIITAGRPVDLARLAEADVPLGDLVPA